MENEYISLSFPALVHLCTGTQTFEKEKLTSNGYGIELHLPSYFVLSMFL